MVDIDLVDRKMQHPIITITACAVSFCYQVLLSLECSCGTLPRRLLFEAAAMILNDQYFP
jgi:hypothetical protein